tara:strand:+ start:1255 stop:1455 length:201 start_codon:yes stop_codon:yes gene_type:complete
MKCPVCGTKMLTVVNRDAFACVSCKIAASGMELRNVDKAKSIKEFVEDGAKLYDELILPTETNDEN